MPVFKHEADDGDLSIVAAENEILIACNHGHYWILQAAMQHTPSTVQAGEATPTALLRFGAPALRAFASMPNDPSTHDV